MCFGFEKRVWKRLLKDRHCVALDERLRLRLDKVLLDIGDDVRHLHLSCINLSNSLCRLCHKLKTTAELECHLHD